MLNDNDYFDVYDMLDSQDVERMASQSPPNFDSDKDFNGFRTDTDNQFLKFFDSFTVIEQKEDILNNLDLNMLNDYIKEETDDRSSSEMNSFTDFASLSYSPDQVSKPSKSPTVVSSANAWHQGYPDRYEVLSPVVDNPSSELDYDSIFQSFIPLENACLNNQDLTTGKSGDLLYLSYEEKRLLMKEGLSHVPTHLPLNRSEDKALRLVRRKIRNKISAKTSRAKKQQYVSQLEQRVMLCNNENVRLKKRVQMLEMEKANLRRQMKTIHESFKKHFDSEAHQADMSKTLGGGGNKKTKSLYILMFCLFLSTLQSPSMNSVDLFKSSTPVKNGPTDSGVVSSDVNTFLPGRSRVLLQAADAAYKSVVKPRGFDSDGPAMNRANDAKTPIVYKVQKADNNSITLTKAATDDGLTKAHNQYHLKTITVKTVK